MFQIPWFKVDDAFHSHPKVIEASNSALGLWVLAGTWCAQYLTDGELKTAHVSRFGGTNEDAQELVEAGLWEATDKGFRFIDWHDYQPTKEAVNESRKRDAERKKRGRESQSKDRKGGQKTSERTPSGLQMESSGPDPTRPDPNTPPTPSQEVQMSFDKWWERYPKKVDKGQALKAFRSKIKDVDLSDLIAATDQYAAQIKRDGTGRQFIKKPSTWLNAEPWLDEPEPPPVFDPWTASHDDYLHPEERADIERRKQSGGNAPF